MKETIAVWVLFKLTWWISVQGAASQGPWPGVAACLTWTLGAAFLLRPGIGGIARWLCIAALGGVAEALLHGLGFVDYPPPSDVAALGPLPLWILGLWLTLATLLSSKLAVLSRRPLLAAVIGAVGGPLSFWTGSRFGATSLGAAPWLGALAIGITWAVLLPVCARLANPSQSQ